MSRYADVEWLKTEFDEANEICFVYLNIDSRGAFEELKRIVEQAPSIDIVRCGECKHWIDDRKGQDDMGTCRLTHYFTNADDFCSYGEPKEELNGSERLVKG